MTTGEQAMATVREIYGAVTPAGDRLRVLDAGCGRRSYLPYDERVRLTGVDISAEELDRNPRLDERIVGDLQDCRLPAAAFDVVVCWDVLEHLENPRGAVVGMCAAVRPGGLLIIGGPVPRSLKAVLAKLSPHWVHVRIFRLLNPQAQEDEHPFRTYLRRDVMPDRLVACGREQGLELVYQAAFESRPQAMMRERLHVTGVPWRVARLLISLATLGRIDPERTDHVTVLRRAA